MSSDIAAVTGTDDERREDTPNQIQVTIGAKVLFGKDSAQLTAAARARLAHVARDIRAHKPTRVSVSGYTDNLGSTAHGLALSRHRAEAVKAALQQELVPVFCSPPTGSARHIPPRTTTRREADSSIDASPSRT
ncbi:OmpA family protein [Streptomyces sp. NPDC087659]|uniref:OmpA family protein n=1 Tax=Streptomyces sp. NPDC087659 TaxID=3365801 RepID=UPI0038137278